MISPLIVPMVEPSDDGDRIDSLKRSVELAIDVLVETGRSHTDLVRAVRTAVVVLAEAARADDAVNFTLH